MLAKRIIPCLDIKDGRTVKGVNFENLRDAGDAVELGEYYAKNGADELVFLDITATNEKRKTLSALVKKIALHVNIPFTVGGGISSVEDVSVLLNSGADKISINTSAVKNPNLISDLAKRFGSQCVVVAIDAKAVYPPLEEAGGGKNWKVFLNGGKVPTDIKAFFWAKEAEQRGAGEILLTSMNHDGTKNGFAIELTKIISESVNIPVIASGGAGTMEHFAEVFTKGKADAALAASIFHFKEIEIDVLKKFLKKKNISVRF
ncbi:MAG: imidazole glycerol phosphate synthase subunit HisF [Bacteroidetes bacterium]|nr:imidazole glycerol phosphate synthase subunit HisF [Bacteroidota bacterium]